MTDIERKIYSVALSVVSGKGAKNINKITNGYSPEKVYREIAASSAPVSQDHIEPVYHSNPLKTAEMIIKKCNSLHARVIDLWDEEYPMLLKEIPSPPLVIYCIGGKLSSNNIAIVGTRKADRRACEIAAKISHDLAKQGYCIVSGMAIGIDREAHLGALAMGAPTTGILANGIDVLYPVLNKDVFRMINESGNSSLVSEYPPGIMAGKWTFARRNRLISGMSMGTVIVKAAEKSGAMITANYALEQNRDVFACPGNAFDASYQGCHNLIRNGAVLVSDSRDIINELKEMQMHLFNMNKNPVKITEKIIFQNKTYPIFNDGSEENKIIVLLAKGPSDVDSIARELNISASRINEIIIELELSGAIIRDGNILSVS